MAATHFVVTKLPENIISKIGIDNLLVDQLYPIALESDLTFERIPSLDGFFLSETMYYKTYNQIDDIYSNEAELKLIWKQVDQGILPSSSNQVYLFQNEEENNLLALLPINNSTEFIEIVSLEGAGKLTVNNNNAFPEDRIEVKNLLNAIYTAGVLAGGYPYFTLTYKVGRNNVTEATEYTMNVNIDSIAELAETNYSETPEILVLESDPLTEHSVVLQQSIIEISKGYQFGTAEFNVNIDCDFLTTADPELQSTVTVEVNGEETVYTINQNLQLVANLDSKGSAIIYITNYIILKAQPQVGQIDVTLISVNQNVALVSGVTFTESIISNFSNA